MSLNIRLPLKHQPVTYCCPCVQDSLKAGGISPGGTAPAGDFLAAVKEGCGVSPQIACHPGSSDVEEVQSPEMLPASHLSLLSLAWEM